MAREKMLNFSGQDREGGMDQEIRTDAHTLSGVKYSANGKLLDFTGSSVWGSLMA